MGLNSILICEDGEAFRTVLSEALREIGFVVAAFPSADAARRQSESTLALFDVILTDFEMPGLKGNLFARQMRSINANSRIIMMSGIYRLTDDDYAAGVELLPKPFLLTELLERLKSVAENDFMLVG